MNPFLTDENISLSTNEAIVGIHPKCTAIRVYPKSGTSYMYINSTSNLPKINLEEGFTVENVDGFIEKLVFGSAGTATVNVKQLTNVGGQIVRG